MAFNASRFVFDGVVSDRYNLTISTMSTGVESVLTGDVELMTHSLPRRNSPYLYEVVQNTPLVFKCEVTSSVEIPATMSGRISRWLFGQSTYKKLQILQGDMYSMYFNCFLMNPKVVKNGNVIIGYTFDVTCDSPWGWTFPKTTTKTYSNDSAVYDTFRMDIQTDSNDYVYPVLVFTGSASGESISITTQDSNNENSESMTLSPIVNGEVLTLDTRNEVITSSLSLNRLSSVTNQDWFRLFPGINNITVTGAVLNLSITYQNARRL